MPDRRPVALIPAYKPEPSLPELIRRLEETEAVQAVICVDDGSGSDFGPIFDRLRDMGVTVLRHAVNLGKGQALKTGFNHILLNYAHSVGVLTLDADGQHLPADAAAVARTLGEHPQELVLGCRRFDSSQVPFRSRFGNRASSLSLRLFTGITLSDTQTGLRGIPLALLPSLLRLRTRGYDFELDMLLVCRRQEIPLREVPIETVYENRNEGSHFNPLLDSMRIYFVLIRFSSVSLLTALLDYLLFAVFILFMPLSLAVPVARILAAAFQFMASARYVFAARGNVWHFLARYALVFAFMAFLAYGSISLLTTYTSLPVLVAKALSETVLFGVSFLLQREFVFRSR